MPDGLIINQISWVSISSKATIQGPSYSYRIWEIIWTYFPNYTMISLLGFTALEIGIVVAVPFEMLFVECILYNIL